MGDYNTGKSNRDFLFDFLHKKQTYPKSRASFSIFSRADISSLKLEISSSTFFFAESTISHSLINVDDNSLKTNEYRHRFN